MPKKINETSADMIGPKNSAIVDRGLEVNANEMSLLPDDLEYACSETLRLENFGGIVHQV